MYIVVGYRTCAAPNAKRRDERCCAENTQIGTEVYAGRRYQTVGRKLEAPQVFTAKSLGKYRFPASSLPARHFPTNLRIDIDHETGSLRVDNLTSKRGTYILVCVNDRNKAPVVQDKKSETIDARVKIGAFQFFEAITRKDLNVSIVRAHSRTERHTYDVSIRR